MFLFQSKATFDFFREKVKVRKQQQFLERDIVPVNVRFFFFRGKRGAKLR